MDLSIRETKVLKMRILFPLTKAGSGSDIFTSNLVSGLKRSAITADIEYFPKWAGYFPPIMGKMCPSGGCDIIHANTWNGFAFKYKCKPLLVTEHLVVHDSSFQPYKRLSQRTYHSFIYQWEKKSIHAAESVVSISKYVQNKIEEIFGYSDSTLIYNGIDSAIFKPFQTERFSLSKKYSIPLDKKVLFFSGNPIIRKGGDLLPKIMNELGDGYILLVSGGLRRNRDIVGSRIISTGKLSLQELVEIYNYSDIFLFPTRLEGFGLSVAEAMACGKPVVTTDCSSIPELIIDGKGGFLCEMDNIKDFAESVRVLADDVSLRKTMGTYNRKRVEKMFTYEKMTMQYIKEYKSLL